MAYSSRFRFLQLPPEICAMVFTEFFSSLSVTVHNEDRRQTASQTPDRISSYCNVLQVNKQFLTEAQPYFFSQATFYIRPDTWRPLDRSSIQLLTGFQHIVLDMERTVTYMSIELNGITNKPDNYARLIVNHFYDFIGSIQLRGTKIQSMTYDMILLTINSERQASLRKLVKQGLKCTRTLLFRLTPSTSTSHGRICKVSITKNGEEGMSMKIEGNFMGDIDNTTAMLCTLIDFDPTMTCVMQKTFAKSATKILTVGEVRAGL